MQILHEMSKPIFCEKKKKKKNISKYRLLNFLSLTHVQFMK